MLNLWGNPAEDVDAVGTESGSEGTEVKSTVKSTPVEAIDVFVEALVAVGIGAVVDC